jgi:hypothetical protein
MYIVGNWVISLHLEISDDFNSIDYCHGVLALLVGFRLQTMAASQRIFRFPEKKKIEDETKRILFSTVNHFFYIQILSPSRSMVSKNHLASRHPYLYSDSFVSTLLVLVSTQKSLSAQFTNNLELV